MVIYGFIKEWSFIKEISVDKIYSQNVINTCNWAIYGLKVQIKISYHKKYTNKLSKYF